MVTTRYKSSVSRALEPLARWLARRGVSPTALSLLGLFGSALVCLLFLRTRAVIPFCLAIAAVGSLDALDGAVARAGGRATREGAYLDALCDRYVDVMVVGSVAIVTGAWALSLLVLAGALLVSYAKARAAMEVRVANEEWPDLMERTERAILFLGGLLLSRLIAWRPLGHDLFWWTLVALALLIHLTVLQRMVRALRIIRERSGLRVEGSGSLPRAPSPEP